MLIDQQEALDALDTQAEEMSHWAKTPYGEQRKGILTARNIIADVSPAEPKTARWITLGHGSMGCSACGTEWKDVGSYYYCPHCGAKIEDLQGKEEAYDGK